MEKTKAATEADVFPGGTYRPANRFAAGSPPREEPRRFRRNPDQSGRTQLLTPGWEPGAMAETVMEVASMLRIRDRPEIEVRARVNMVGNLTARWAIVSRTAGTGAESTEDPVGRHFMSRPPTEFLYLRDMEEFHEPDQSEEVPPPDDSTHHAMLELLDRWRREIANTARIASVDVMHDIELTGPAEAVTGFRIRWTTTRAGTNHSHDTVRTNEDLKVADEDASILTKAAGQLGHKGIMQSLHAKLPREPDTDAAGKGVDLDRLAVSIRWQSSTSKLRKRLREAVGRNLGTPFADVDYRYHGMFSIGLSGIDARRAAEFLARLDRKLDNRLIPEAHAPDWLRRAMANGHDPAG